MARMRGNHPLDGLYRIGHQDGISMKSFDFLMRYFYNDRK